MWPGILLDKIQLQINIFSQFSRFEIQWSDFTSPQMHGDEIDL